MLNLTPRQIVTELDRYVIGQTEAKRALALAARNFWRMHKLEKVTASNLLYRNLLLYGPTGCGKTSLTRYFADVIGLRFTHVPVTMLVSEGYRGYNISDMLEQLHLSAVYSPSPITRSVMDRYGSSCFDSVEPPVVSSGDTTPEWLTPVVTGKAFKSQSVTYDVVMLDEIDKMANAGDNQANMREVLQQLLTLLDAKTYAAGGQKVINFDLTRCMFVCAGAFSSVKQIYSMMPELQGRLPNLVEMTALKKEDMVRILYESADSPLTQMHEMLKLEGVEVNFTESAVHKIANAAFALNAGIQNLGARRLHQVTQRLFEDISFRAPELAGSSILIDENYFMLSKLDAELKKTKERA